MAPQQFPFLMIFLANTLFYQDEFQFSYSRQKYTKPNVRGGGWYMNKMKNVTFPAVTSWEIICSNSSATANYFSSQVINIQRTSI